LGPFRIFTKIRGDIRSFVLFAIVNYNGDTPFTGVTGNKL